MSTVQQKRRSRDSGGPRDRSEDNNYIEHVVKINRVAKVVKGGRNLRFSALVVVGDGNGKVGAAKAKARGISDAIRKAMEKAKKYMVEVPIVQTTVPHDVTGRADAAEVLLKPASLGTGVIAGGPVRYVLEAAGYRNVLSKSLGSNNPTNVVWATLEALRQLQTTEEVAERRRLSEQDVL